MTRVATGDASAVVRATPAGRELDSASAVADSKQILLCTYLSGVLLIGLLLNSVLGWSWADPVAVTEGREAWRGEHCC
jgi:divalent metal cation (Fe/Co/Zn/Cd) transporter